MNKQDKKEIMNLIKYKKMLGDRRMNLEKAIKRLKPFINDCDNNCPSETCGGCYICYYEVQAIKAIIEALDERYNKGYQDGFKQAKFDCEMDKLDGR